MPAYRIGQVAELLGVSADTVRRWADAGRFATTRTASGQREVDGAELARFVREAAETADPETPFRAHSARNRFPGIVTRVRVEGLVAQVELQAGPFRVVSLLTREAVEELGLEPGMLATGIVKSTSVVIEAPPA